MATTLNYHPIKSLPETQFEELSWPSVEDEDSERRDRSRERLLDEGKKNSKKVLKSNVGQEVRQQVVKEVKRQTLRIALRVFNFGGAATLVGIFVPLIIMNAQLFLFNLLFPNTDIGKLLKLAWWEIIFIVILDLLAIFGFIILIMISVGMSPTFWLPILVDVIWAGFKQQVCNMVPASCGVFGL